MENGSRATWCWIALILAVLAWPPALVNYWPVVLVCFVTIPVGVAYLSASPKLAIATLYWSTATLVSIPLNLVGAPVAVFPAILFGGLALPVVLSLNYQRRPR